MSFVLMQSLPRLRTVVTQQSVIFPALVLLCSLICGSLKAQSDDALTLAAQHKERLSSVLNSYPGVVSPVLSYDGKRLYFSRKYYPENVGQTRDPDDVWFSEQDAMGQWTEARNLGSPINTPESNVLCSITPLSNIALLQTTLAAGPLRTHAFAFSRFEGGRWTEPEALIVDNIRNDSKNFYAHLSFDARFLFLALEAPGGRGSLDLYVCERKGSTLHFGSPLNLGPVINSPGTEGSPCLAFDGKTLYFSSDGHGGFGSQDLFVTHRLDDGWTRWSEPLNLGPSINTPFLDHCFSLSSDGGAAMIISADSLGTMGMYKIDLPTELRMGPSQVPTEPADSQSTRQAVHAASVIEFDLHFDHDKSVLDADELRRSLTNPLFRTEERCWSVELEGYTDSTGTEEHNERLSAARIISVRKALRSYMRQCFRISTERRYGASHPLGDNALESGRAQNRRVHVRLKAVEQH